MSTPEEKAAEAKKADEMVRRNYCQNFGHQYTLLGDLTAIVCANRCGLVALTGRAGVDLVRKMWPEFQIFDDLSLEALRAAFPQYAIIPKTPVAAKPELVVPGSKGYHLPVNIKVQDAATGEVTDVGRFRHLGGSQFEPLDGDDS